MKNKLLQIITLSFLGLGSFLATSTSNAQGAQDRILISVGDLKDNGSHVWKRNTCDQLYKLFNQIGEKAVDVTCRSFDTNSFKDEFLTKAHEQYSYHIRVMRNKKDELMVDVTNWRRMYHSDFVTLGWTFRDGLESKISKEAALTRALANFYLYASNEVAFKSGLLIMGSKDSTTVEYDQKNNSFKDKFTGEKLSFNQAYLNFEGESERKRNYLRTGIEIGVLLSSGLALYYKNLAYNKVDFDYGLWDGLQKKATGEAILFDDNDKFANYGHVYAGVLYYQIARSNDFNSLESFLITFASSAAWELLEYHEVFSLNDQILTPIGGYVIGEAGYQISCALLQKKGLGSKAVGYLLNPAMGVNHLADKAMGKKPFTPADCQKPRWSEISVFVGLEKGQKPYQPQPVQNNVVGLDAEVINLSDYGKEGQAERLVLDTAMVKAFIEHGGGDKEGGGNDLRVIAQVVAAAYYNKDLQKDQWGQLRGYEMILGLGSASTWNDRGSKQLSANEDFYGTINVLGASAKVRMHYRGAVLNAEFAFYGDFAMVKAWSLNDFRDSNGGNLNNQLSVVQRKGYYWGVGSTVLAALSWEYENWKLGYKLQSSDARDIKSRNRNQEKATDPANFEDSYVSQEIYVTYKLSKSLHFTLSREYIVRNGSYNNISSNKGTHTRTMGKLVYLF